MRVLLPLRKFPNSQQPSDSSEGDERAQEYFDQQGQQYQWVTLGDSSSQSLEAAQFASFESLQQGSLSFQSSGGDLDQKPSPLFAGQKTTGLPSLAAASLNLNRKRQAAQAGLVQVPPSKRACAALDQKPPARDLSGSNKESAMVGTGRLRYYAETRQQDQSPETISTDPFENNPALTSSNASNSSCCGGPEELDDEFAILLKKQGLEIKKQAGDGNCLFRAISLQVYGDPSMHEDVRMRCMDFMERDKEHFSQFVTGEPFEEYVQRKRQDGVHGNHTEIQAISELFNRPVEVFCPENGATPLNIFHAEYKTNDEPIRLSYHDGNHYNAVVNPLVPTAGLGLGLPGLQPGLADKMQVAKAVAESDAAADQVEYQRALKESEDDELQRAIKESKLSAEHMYSHEAMALSDMDATFFELEQAALERSMSSCPKNEQGKKQGASTSTARRKKAERHTPLSTGSALQPSSSDCARELPPQSAVASLPSDAFGTHASSGAAMPNVAAAASVASAASAAAAPSAPLPLGNVDEYPPTVQELVMNGFELVKVVRAYELIGDNFDGLLAFLMSNTSRTG